MKKFGLVLFAVLFSFNANAFDLTEASNKFANDVNKTSEAVETRKAQAEAKKAELKEKAAAKKAEAEAKKEEMKAKAEAKKAEAKAKKEELKNKAAAKKAEAETKKAERKKAFEDAKGNLKNAFGK